ncbi:MAG: SRPBCC family protein, partial [Myxococcaceae bacterium]
EEAKVLSSEGGDKVIIFYSVINAPLVDRRDYCIRILDESNWADPKATLKVSWKASDKCIPEKEGLVRVKINDGYWTLAPRDNGTKTFATYYVFTDPGGSIPKWIANKANSTAVPNVFEAIRKVIADNRAAAQKK